MKNVNTRPVITIGVVTVSLIVALSGCGDNKQQASGTTSTTSASKSASTSATKSETTSSETPTSGAQVEIGETINYGSIDTTETLDCASGKSLNVLGSNNTLTVKGSCTDVTVGGSGNKITLDQVDKTISVVGINNKITYKAGDPKIDKLGDSNEVTKG
jgi:hypothetical protein